LTVPRDELIDLEPDEEVLVTARASFRGAAAVTTRATFALGSERMRMRAFQEWQSAAHASNMGDVPPDMVVVATHRRVLFGKPTHWGRAPSQYWSSIDLADIAQIVAVRHGLVTGVAFGLTNGAVVEIEAMRGNRLRQFAQAVEEHLPRR
jgi:hypothetical protein